VKKWNLLETSNTPEGKRLTLRERDGQYALYLEGVELMSSRETQSEQAMADLGCDALEKKPSPRVLVGGLGLGFTLRAVLKKLPPHGRVDVAEVFSCVVEWNRNPTYSLAVQEISDSRVEVFEQDVLILLKASSDKYDCVLLDVDNGPNALTLKTNAALYSVSGLRLLKNSLREGGRAVLWSVERTPDFERIATQSGFRVTHHRTRSTKYSSPPRSLYLLL
jgi:spermidine synthase